MKKAKQLLVGLKTHEQAIELTDTACRVAAPGAHLLLVHVIEVPDVTPLDAKLPDLERKAEQVLRAAARVAQHSGREFRTVVLRARAAGRALLDLMREEHMELAVLGSHHGRTVREFLFGTTHQFLARYAPCRILLSIPPAKTRMARAA